MRRFSPPKILLPVMLILPALLVLLFECLKGQKALMDGWVSGFMAPAEQFLGRVWSLLPWFSVAEVLTALLLAGSAAWLIRAVVLLVRERAGGRFLRRLLAFGSALLWLWAAVSWMWNAAYYASSFQGRSGLKAEPYSVETLAQVTALFARNQLLRSRAARYVASAGSLLLDSRRAEACSANFEKVRRYVKRLCIRLLPRTEEMGSEELRLLSAITPKGEVFYQGTVQALADKCILFRDDYGAVSRLLLELIRAEALARGYHIITCPCAMHPEDKIDHIIIPSLRLAFLTDNRWHPVRLSAAQTVRCSRFVDRENLSACRARLRFNERAAAELLEQACALMAQAKSCHDELETYYRTAVDFAQVDAAAAQCMELFGVG